MKNIAILLTCHNRKDKTIKCLQSLFLAKELYQNDIDLTVYCTDDGCTDGTASAIIDMFKDKQIKILSGTGLLYWAGGMRNSWNEALKIHYDGYLLLNDDTYLNKEAFDELFSMQKFSIKEFKTEGIYCGITCESINEQTTYGGRIIVSSFFYTSKSLHPNGNFQSCDLGNANIMYVPQSVVNKIGILDKNYIHGMADYDYTLKAKNKKIPVLVSSKYIGICENDHSDKYVLFRNKNLIQRIKFLNNPLNLAFTDNLYYMRKHFPQRYLLYLVIGWFKTIFPNIYLQINRKRFDNMKD